MLCLNVVFECHVRTPCPVCQTCCNSLHSLHLLYCRHASTCKPFEPVSGPHVWYRQDYQDVDSYSYTLSKGDIQELASAVAEVQRRGIELKVHRALVGSLSCPAFALSFM